MCYFAPAKPNMGWHFVKEKSIINTFKEEDYVRN